MNRIVIILAAAFFVASLSNCIPPAPPGPAIDVNGVWKVMTINGVDQSSLNDVYTLNNGIGSYTFNGTSTGDGFTYTVSGNDVTLSGAFDEYLSDGKYSASINGTDMTWIHSYTSVITVFSKQ